MKKKSITTFNIIRAISAVSIFLYHAYYNMGCDYGCLNPIISQSSFFMTIFFMLSGFVLYYNYAKEDLANRESLSKYYVKRIVSIYPLYLLVWIVFYIIQWPGNTVSSDLFTLPYQLLLIQNISNYPYLMNSGTWFFSCMMICYLISPFLMQIFRMLDSKKNTIISIFIIGILISFMPLLAYLYGVEIYGNAFGRIFEFSLGMILCKLAESSVNNERQQNEIQFLCNGLIFLIFSLSVVYILRTRVGIVKNNHEYLRPVSVLLGGGIVWLCYIDQADVTKKIAESRIVRFFSDYSLEFWVATFFTTELYNYVFRAMVSVSQYPKLYGGVVTFAINIIIAVFLMQYNKISRKIVNLIGVKKLFLSVLGIFLMLIMVKTVMQIPDYIKESNHIYEVGDEVIFGAEECNSDSYIIRGISHPEDGYAWTDGNEVELIFNGMEKGKYLVAIDLSGVFNNSQSVQLQINGETVYSSVINTENVDSGIEVEVNVEGSMNMTILLPDAVSPQQTGESTDERLLALQIKSIVIQKMDR